MKEISSTVTFPYMYIQICVTRCIFAHQNPNDNSFNVLTYCEHRRRNNTSTHYEIKIFKKLKIIHRVPRISSRADFNNRNIRNVRGYIFGNWTSLAVVRGRTLDRIESMK